jgi:hypothetical protein
MTRISRDAADRAGGPLALTGRLPPRLTASEPEAQWRPAGRASSIASSQAECLPQQPHCHGPRPRAGIWTETIMMVPRHCRLTLAAAAAAPACPAGPPGGASRKTRNVPRPARASDQGASSASASRRSSLGRGHVTTVIQLPHLDCYITRCYITLYAAVVLHDRGYVT